MIAADLTSNLTRSSRRALIAGLALLALVVLAVGSAPGALALGPNALRSGFDSSTLARNDDGSTGLVGMGFTIDFFGTNYSSLYVNNNGNVTFDNPLSTFTPFNIITAGRVIMAPFFGDVDTRRAGSPVKYGAGTVDGRTAFGVSYRDADCYSSSSSRTVKNYFQLILVERGDTGLNNFDIEFNYDQIQWQAGQASGGNFNCQGGSPARVGYSNGSTAAFELPGSGVNWAFLDSGPAGTRLIGNSLNTTQLGRYIFRVRAGVVSVNEADLSIAKTASPDTVSVGNNLTYTITVTNNGPGPANGVTISDPLPAGVNFVSAPGCTFASGVVSCSIGALAVGSSVTRTITVTPTSSAGTSITNTASVTGDEVDPTNGNDTASAATTVIHNQPPTVSAVSSSVAVNEGDTANNSGSFSDPNSGDVVSITASAGSISQSGTQNGT